ncbi:hypothetical protein MaudCBS49596_000320 [Microsporum audouinii]
MDDKPTASHFASLAVTPIAALFPGIDSPEERYLHAVVTLLWPFSSATKQFSLHLSEPDSRLRGGKGQIKAVFREGAAEAVAKSSIGIGDTVFLSLHGAKWKSGNHAESNQLDYMQWDLLFDDQVLLEAQRNSIPLSIVNLKAASYEQANKGTADLPATPKRLSTGISSPISISNRSWVSPAFSRISNAPFSSPLLDSHIEEDGYVPGKGRKRTKFSRPSSDWVFVDSAPSPTKDGDIWEDENLETDNEEMVEQVINDQHSPFGPPSESLPPTEENTNTHEPVNQDFVRIHGSNSNSTVPPISKTPEIAQDIPKDIGPQPVAVHQEIIREQQRLSPKLLGIETPRLHPVASPSIPAISPLGTSIGASTNKSMTPADSTDMALPLIISPSIHATTELDVHSERDQGAILKSRASELLLNQECKASFDHPTDILVEPESYSGDLEVSTPTETNDLPENTAKETTPLHKDLERVETENFEVLSTYSDASSDVGLGNDDGATATSVKSLGATSEEHESDQRSSVHSPPSAGDVEEFLSPKPNYRHSVSSDGDSSYDEASKRSSPMDADTETAEREVFVISDNEPDAYESEAESVTQNLPSSAVGSSGTSMHSRSPSLEKSTINELVKDTTGSSIIESRASSASPSINFEDEPPLSDAGALDNAAQSPTENQTAPVTINSLVPFGNDIRQPTESGFSQPGLHQYLCDAICNPNDSHIHTDFAVNETNPMDSRGEELISSFLAPQPTDFITPENTQGSWAPSGPRPQNPSLPIHLEAIMPTPQHSQTTEPPFTASFAESHPYTIVSSPSSPIPSHPNISTSAPTEVDNAKMIRVGVQKGEATDDSAKEAPETVHHRSPRENASIEPEIVLNVDTEIFGLRTKFSYYCPLSRLIENFNQSVDCIAIVVEITPINRTAKGIKEYYVILRLTDESSGGSTTTAQIFHKKKDALPMPAEGDVILLRNFRVQSLNHRMVLNNMENSAWAFFPQESVGDVRIDDAPVEFGSEEQNFATHLREWYGQEGADLVARNISRDSQQESIDVSSRSTSEAGSQLRNIIKKRRRESRITYHELRDGKRYADVGSPSDTETIHELRNGTLYAHPG